jgi:hypothetical protein
MYSMGGVEPGGSVSNLQAGAVTPEPAAPSFALGAHSAVTAATKPTNANVSPVKDPYAEDIAQTVSAHVAAVCGSAGNEFLRSAKGLHKPTARQIHDVRQFKGNVEKKVRGLENKLEVTQDIAFSESGWQPDSLAKATIDARALRESLDHPELAADKLLQFCAVYKK